MTQNPMKVSEAVREVKRRMRQRILSPCDYDDINTILASHEALRLAAGPFAETAKVISAKASDGSCWAGQTPAPCITHGDLRALSRAHQEASE